ncbi:phosphate/phosphite/phosphonate ABC transporter substrate-binding protein [Geomesophilobacter sediminis]|uniref:Phosphate/phosphite/phosphonate ABC transporter substrate-binding protein n=1 Tax=Geomesophilobacter sediminis TaxID=2798584 RepID=A0A8J7M366_9BACT|nr:phosphate/phosphite/phosphonate ABC transporter substrate-binding protein [Geomesophilobacter sediminis]MBJ6727398.1 phosphate/phosphite/phosphonate ABC transporter substrate-binding protein [Geomesophilobacter sediminis]
MRKCGIPAMTVVCLLFLLPILFPNIAPPALAASSYTIGIVPQYEQRKLYAIWKPIVDELERRTGLSFRLVTTLQIQDFDREISRGSFDFIYVNPYYIVQTRKTQGYLPLVCDKTQIHGVLVVKKEGPVRSVRELNGKTVALPSPNAIGASLMMRADLDQMQVAITPLYVKTHSSVYLHVVKGMAAAGGGIDKTLAEQPPAVRDALRVIHRTRPIPSHPVAVHPRVPKRDAEIVRQALIAMGSDPKGKELLAKVPFLQIGPTTQREYLKMVDWGLEHYWIPQGD